MVETVKTTVLPIATALADTDEVVVNQGATTKRGLLTLVSDYVANKLWGVWTAYTPTVSASTPAGSGFATTIHTARYKKVGRTVHVAVEISVTNLGTGPAASGSLTVTLPATSANRHNGGGKEIALSSKGLVANVSSGSAIMDVALADGSSSALSVVGRKYCVYMTFEANA